MLYRGYSSTSLKDGAVGVVFDSILGSGSRSHVQDAVEDCSMPTAPSFKDFDVASMMKSSSEAQQSRWLGDSDVELGHSRRC